MRSLRRPQAGDSSLSAKDLAAAFDEVKRSNNFVAAGGMTSGPAGVALPPPEEPPFTKIVRLNPQAGVGHDDFGQRPAYGGAGESSVYGNVAGNALAKQYKNFVDFSDKENGTGRGPYVTPADCEVQAFDGRKFNPTGEVIKVVYAGFIQISQAHIALVTPLDDTHWVVTSLLGPGLDHPVLHFIDPLSNGGEGQLAFKDAKLLNGFSSSQIAPYGMEAKHAFAHMDGDVFIHAPGYYKVVYGVKAYASGHPIPNVAYCFPTEQPYPPGSGGSPHYHIFRQPVPLVTRLSLLMDYGYDGHALRWDLDGGCNLMGNHGTEVDQMPIMFQYAPYINSNAYASYQNYEKTTVIRCTWDKWHGGLYTRLCLAVGCAVQSFNNIGFDVGATNNAKIQFTDAYMIIEPIQGVYNSSSGFTNNLGPNKSYQWWGGGPTPPRYNRDGTVYT